ncbi:hypothetical protein BD309DRAFT_648317 [Dichomitus squalens]|uniref:Uncharacterized protein n=1 Tax=Dichomitus squalens TaxID=114155 RepID=A0A4Q9MKR2_9APHY|nr:hypothetical protein BD311DRAFT_762350 [Dichomitus squalens]TBU37197.1 hypothetical protein BD309DRAFT_648317 [Dichomitus squalens]
MMHDFWTLLSPWQPSCTAAACHLTRPPTLESISAHAGDPDRLLRSHLNRHAAAQLGCRKACTGSIKCELGILIGVSPRKCIGVRKTRFSLPVPCFSLLS